MHGITAARKPFLPTDIPNCAVWLRSDLGVVSAGAATVQRWQNQAASGAANDATANGGTGPLYVGSGGLNNLPYMNFTAAGVFNWGYTTALGAKTFVLVLVDTANLGPGTGETVFAIGAGTGAPSCEFILDLATYQPSSFVVGWQTGSGNMVGIANVINTATGYIYVITGDGSGNTTADYTATLNGAPATVAASGAYGSASTGAIGSRLPAAFPFDGQLYELIVIERVCSQFEQQQLVGYCRGRYAI